MDLRQRGIWYGIGAYVVWGLSPIYWNLVDGVPEIELLANRIVWALLLLVLAISIRRGWARLGRTYRAWPTIAAAFVGAVLLSTNWGIFIWAVTNGRIVDVSLGYFMTPLVSVALGVVILREQLRPAQRLAVAIAAVGVVVMMIVAGVVPWVSLVLAFSFGFYGLLKKHPGAARAFEGLVGEIAFVAVPAAVVLVGGASAGSGHLGTTAPTTIWLIGTGVITVVPLLLFGMSAQLIPLSTVGLLQYLAPALQLLVGVVVYGERLGGGQVFGFAMVWIALAVFTRDQVRLGRRLAAEARRSR